MGTRGLGLLLVLTFVIAVGTIIQDFRFDNSIARERAVSLGVDREVGSLSVALANLRAAQAGYLASGQDPAFWMTQVADVSADVDAAIRRHRAAATHEAARKRYDAAAAALAAFTAIDNRARSYVRTEQRLLASDLVFVDSIEALAKLSGELDAARAAEMSASQARLSRLQTLRFAMNALAMGFVLAVALFFKRASVEAAAPAAEPVTPIAEALGLGRLAPPAPRAPIPVPEHALSLVDAAALCGDLAKVTDTRDVPALFERAAGVLAAKGAVLWVADAGGARLRPSLTHGYSDRVLAKMGPLQVDAENATSLAYRSKRPQTVHGEAPGSPGAIAVPLLAASGCVGVLAAETRQQKPGHDVLPVAQMIAAQFAALVTTADAPGQKTG